MEKDIHTVYIHTVYIHTVYIRTVYIRTVYIRTVYILIRVMTSNNSIARCTVLLASTSMIGVKA